MIVNAFSEGIEHIPDSDYVLDDKVSTSGHLVTWSRN